MKKICLIFLLLVFYSYGQDIGIKTPVIRNLPENYKKIFLNFFINNFKNIQPYNPENKFDYIIKPYISSIAGSYNLCIDVFKAQKPIHIICISAESGEQLADKIINEIPKEIEILHLQKEIPIKRVNLQLESISPIHQKNIKITSHNGDTLIEYKEILSPPAKAVISFNKVIINIDTALLNNKQAAKLMEYLLNGYRIQGILIKKSE
ncbi:hypothetical protein [Persephonella sp. IF05-L8]|uniref:hypothetical protein n=1 Tax=Persephonella sp. IF05-L8 TaxID=1158338 RepID=UPI0004969FD3